MKITNHWHDPNNEYSKEFYNVENHDLAYSNGHFYIYRYYGEYLYTYKNHAISHRVGYSEEIVDRFVNNDRPFDNAKFNAQYNFDAAMKIVKKVIDNE